MRFRHWLGTSFHITKIDDDPTKIASLAYQLELCPSTSRRHLQFCISFTNPRTARGVQQYVGDNTCHIEPTRNLNASLAYCNKLDSRLPDTTPYYRVTEDTDWRTLTEFELWQLKPEWMLRNHIGVRRFFSLHNTETLQARETPKCFIFWGAPGTSKSYSARCWSGSDYYIKPPGEFWIGYTNQTTVIFDDYYSSEKFDNLLRWISENPIHVNVKGSSKELKATKFAFTSNLNPREWHKNIEDKSALWRRITKVFFCTKDVFYFETLH